MRRLIAQQLQVSDQSDFALLDCIGGECIGAVTFLKSGQILPAPTVGHHQWRSYMSDLLNFQQYYNLGLWAPRVTTFNSQRAWSRIILVLLRHSNGRL
uniref:HipA N-terminal subdomain 1 domain-containing protein n=1 Tax=Candidatus Nitrotoga fabula TaxID=2182327 RepID=A0A2X0RB42_9PROT|nr:protein of unknown function [Candidatus Nitrotoga fabula]